MKPGGSKQKGAQFERDVCEFLSQWLSEGKRKDLFWRSAMSGGRATVARKRGKHLKAQEGDITATHPIGHKLTNLFLIECKFYANLNILSMMEDGEVKTGLAFFWDKLCEDAEKSNKYPMLIAKENRRKPLLILTSLGLDEFQPLDILDDEVAAFPRRGASLFYLEEFFSASDPRYLKQINIRNRK